MYKSSRMFVCPNILLKMTKALTEQLLVARWNVCIITNDLVSDTCTIFWSVFVL